MINEAYGQIKVSEYGMQLYARDGTVLSAGVAGEQLHVWVTDANGRAIVRIVVEEDLAILTEFYCGYHSVADYCQALLYARHVVVYDDDEGYVWDRPALGGRELVVEFVSEEDGNAVRD